MKTDKPFFDTNILLYLLSNDNSKADCAEMIIAMGGMISVQVLNEFASVAFRKLGMSYHEIREYWALSEQSVKPNRSRSKLMTSDWILRSDSVFLYTIV